MINTNTDRYTVATFARKHETFLTENALRFQIFHARTNRMEEFKVIERIGRKILINEKNYFAWVEGINEKGVK